MRAKDVNNPGFNWKFKTNSVKVDNLDSNLVNYLSTIPKHLQDKLITTSGNDGSVHSSTSRHYKNKAVDFGFNQEVWDYVVKDPNRLKYGVTLLDPNHGTGKHFHFSTGQGTENKKDIWMDPHSDAARKFVQTHFGGDGHNHSEDELNSYNNLNDPNNTNQVYGQNQGGANTEFYQKLIQEEQARRDQLAQQYKAEKESADRQNAIQERVKAKMEHQVQMMELINSNELGVVKRNRRGPAQFKDGGEFDGLNENIDFQIAQIKASMPKFSRINPEDSDTYRELMNSESRLQTLLSNPPKEVVNTYLPMTNPSDMVAQNPDEPTSETKIGRSKSSVANKLFDKLSTIGLKPHQIAGVIGSLTGESGDELSSVALNPTSKAFGIAQWLGSRLTDLKEFGKKQGRDFKNEDIQIDFLLHEITNTYEKKVVPHLLKAKTSEEAARIWTNIYERPGHTETEKVLRRRLANARSFEKQFTS